MAVIDRDRWRALEPLLDEALDLSAEDRVPWLGALHSRAPDLAADLEALLSGELTADDRGFLAEPLGVTPASSSRAMPGCVSRASTEPSRRKRRCAVSLRAPRSRSLTAASPSKRPSARRASHTDPMPPWPSGRSSR